MLAVLGLSTSAVPASAQIYSWRDGNGNLVVSNNKKPEAGAEVTSYEVPKAAQVRATRYVKPDSSRQYDEIIAEHASNHGVRTALVRAVIQVESGFNAYAQSPKGALGLMQLMPATAKQFGVVNPFNPKENIRAGVAYLRELLDRYSNDEEIALAAYNAGPGAVDRYSQSVPPYRETQNYVSKVSEIAKPQVKIPGTKIYQIVQIIDGQERVLYSTDPAARINPAALPPSDPASRTPAQVLQSSGVFRAP
jgi:soluble lytic murein transglycosylase-like protein